MILERRGLPALGSQVEIAHELGGDPENGIGCYIFGEKHSIAPFFKRRGGNLKVVRYPIESFDSEHQLRRFLQQGLDFDHDLLISFFNPILNHEIGGYGHIALVEQVLGRHLLLCDPEPKHEFGRKFLLSTLFSTAKAHDDWGTIRVISERK